MLDRYTKNFIFSKFIFRFLAFYIVIGIGFAGFLYSMFSERISLALDLIHIRQTASSFSFKTLDNLNKYSQATGIYVMDSSNKVIFVQKGDEFKEGTDLSFEKHRLFPEGYIINNDQMTVYSPINTQGIFEKSTDEFTESNNKIPYLFSMDYHSINYKDFRMFEVKDGQKVLITLSISPVKNGEIAFKTFKLYLLLGLGVYWFSLVLWAYKKAQTNSLNPPAWAMAVMLTNFIGAIILSYTVYKLDARKKS